MYTSDEIRTNRHYVRVSTVNPRYFELNHATFIPIGVNLCFPRFLEDEAEILAYYRDYLADFARVGGNFIRIWLGAPFFELEPEREGEFDPTALRRLQTVTAMAEAAGIRIKFTLEHFRTMENRSQIESYPGAASFVKTVYRPDRGGSVPDMAAYFSGGAGEEVMKRKLAFLSEYFRDCPTVMAWELWNEVNAVNAGEPQWTAWTANMLREAGRSLPHHLKVQSLGSFDTLHAHRHYNWLSSLPDNDFFQVHRYLDPGAELDVCRGPVDLLCADAIRCLREKCEDKPVVLAESGAVEWRHSRPSHLYRADREGMLLHDILFAPFFAGAAGCGQCWHWDMYIMANRLWWHFGRFARAIRGIDPAAENYRPYALDGKRLRLYGLRGKTHSLLWCRDKFNTWESELEQGRAPERLTDLTLDARAVCPRAVRQAEYYLPWEDEAGPLPLRDEQLQLPSFQRSIVLKLQH